MLIDLFSPNLLKKLNLERNLLVLVHSLLKFKLQRSPIEPWLPVGQLT